MDYKQLTKISLEQLMEEKIRRPMRAFKKSAKLWARKNWYKLAFLSICAFFAVQKDLNFNTSSPKQYDFFSIWNDHREGYSSKKREADHYDRKSKKAISLC